MAKPTTKSPSIAGSQTARKSNFGDDLIDQMPDVDDDEFLMGQSQLDIVCVYNGPAVRFRVGDRKFVMRHGDVAQVEAAYATPRQMRSGGDPLPSALELLTNRKVLPVQDPRVDKNPETGVPRITEAKRKAEVERASKTPLKQEGASAQ